MTILYGASPQTPLERQRSNHHSLTKSCGKYRIYYTYINRIRARSYIYNHEKQSRLNISDVCAVCLSSAAFSTRDSALFGGFANLL